jgi:hypothetical protein
MDFVALLTNLAPFSLAEPGQLQIQDHYRLQHREAESWRDARPGLVNIGCCFDQVHQLDPVFEGDNDRFEDG